MSSVVLGYAAAGDLTWYFEQPALREVATVETSDSMLLAFAPAGVANDGASACAAQCAEHVRHRTRGAVGMVSFYAPAPYVSSIHTRQSRQHPECWGDCHG